MARSGKHVSGNPSKLPKTDDVRNQVMGHMMAAEQGSPDVLLDTTRAVMLDGMEVCRVNAYSNFTDNTSRGGPEMHEMIAMVLEGRINKSPDRTKVMWMFDADGAAAIITELLALASRMGPEFNQLLHQRMETLERNGNIGPQEQQPMDPDAFYESVISEPERWQETSPIDERRRGPRDHH